LNLENLKIRLKEKFEKASVPSRKNIRLSQIHICPRFQWFTFSQEQTFDLETLGHFIKGSLWENWVKDVFPEAQYQREVSFCGVKGHIDFFFPETETVLEIKATSSSAIPFLPDTHHIWQVRAYMAALKEEGFENPKGFILYIPSDNPVKMLELFFPVDLQEWMINELRERVEDLKKAVEEGVEPPIPKGYEPEKEPCVGISYGKPFICPFHERCWIERGHQIVKVSANAIDKAGKIIEVLEAINQRLAPFLTYKEQVEEKVREYLQSREDLRAIEFRGERWRLIAMKGNDGREIVDREALEREFGKEWVRRFSKRTKPSVKVNWEKVK